MIKVATSATPPAIIEAKNPFGVMCQWMLANRTAVTINS